MTKIKFLSVLKSSKKSHFILAHNISIKTVSFMHGLGLKWSKNVPLQAKYIPLKLLTPTRSLRSMRPGVIIPFFNWRKKERITTRNAIFCINRHFREPQRHQSLKRFLITIEIEIKQGYIRRWMDASSSTWHVLNLKRKRSFEMKFQV